MATTEALMTAYRRGWIGVTVTATALGAGWCLYAVRPPVYAPLAVSIALIAGAVELVRWRDGADGADGAEGAARPDARFRVWPAEVAGAVALGFIGWTVAIQAAGAWLWVLLAVASPPVVRRVAQVLGAGERLRAAERSRTASPLSALPTAELVTLWRRSEHAVLDASDERACAAVVARRASYLDELERRDPAQFRSWIEADPIADRDLAGYVPPG